MSPRLRSLYRRLLRELPSRPAQHAVNTRSSQSILSNPSPLQRHIRSTIQIPAEQQAVRTPSIEETEQFAQYAKAQRMYITLVERYNPGVNLTDEERVRLTARRVGMDLPVEAEALKDPSRG